jgi:hypothetical protein
MYVPAYFMGILLQLSTERTEALGVNGCCMG